MITSSTTRDLQRITFVESLHDALKQQANKAIKDQKKFLVLANSYMVDGLEENECIELLMIDGLSREAAESYTSMTLSDQDVDDTSPYEYSFQFEDVYGKVWSSCDIGEGIKAANDKEAWEKAELMLNATEKIESDKILSVSRIS